MCVSEDHQSFSQAPDRDWSQLLAEYVTTRCNTWIILSMWWINVLVNANTSRKLP